jgi:hypothetical protein
VVTMDDILLPVDAAAAGLGVTCLTTYGRGST